MILTFIVMELLIDYDYLKGAKGETVVKEISVAANDVLQTFHFRSPYPMSPLGSEENGRNWIMGSSHTTNWKPLWMRRSLDIPISAATVLQNANFSLICSVAQFSI